MDEKKEERKKESIDEILSDLNGLLNKMPAILEGIKLPEIKPVDFTSVLKEEPAPVVPAPSARPVPAVIPEQAAPGIEVETFERPIARAEIAPAAAAAPEEKDKMVLQSLGEYMFSPDSKEPGEKEPLNAPRPEPGPFTVEPAGLESAPELPEIKPAPEEVKTEERVEPSAEPRPEPLFAAGSEGTDPEPGLPEIEPAPEEVKPEAARTETPVGETNHFSSLESLMAEEAAIEKAFKRGPEIMEEEKKTNPLEGTKDFGVPDIDAMMRFSQEEAMPAKDAVNPDEPSAEPAGEVPEIASSREKAPSPDPEPGLLPEQDPVSDPAPEQKREPAPASKPEPEPDLEQFIIEPASGAADEKGGVMDLKEENSGKDEISGAQDALEHTLSGQPETAKPEQQAPETPAPAAEPQLTVSPAPGLSLDVKEKASEPGLVIERADSVFNAKEPSLALPADDDKTMIVPPSSSAPDEDKTVIYEAGSNPGVTSRRREDLDTVAAKPVPEGIPPERVRTVAFLYAREDAPLCSEMLSELDAICLKSSTKPMFIKRAFVQICEPGMNGQVAMQKVTDAKAVGLVCLGDIPQENVYEIENAFTAGGTLFRHLTKESFSHSAALDLVTEFILK